MKVSVLSKGKGGVVEGVVKTMKEFSQGDILFTEYLSLADSYRYIPIASLIILTTGGLLTHVAIIGREYGIPVIRVENGKDLVGKRIRVDLEKGELEVVG